MSTVNFVLWKTNSILLQVAEVRDNKKTNLTLFNP